MISKKEINGISESSKVLIYEDFESDFISVSAIEEITQELINNLYNDLKNQIDAYQGQGSGFIYIFSNLTIQYFEIVNIKGNSYIPTPMHFKNKHNKFKNSFIFRKKIRYARI